MNKRKKKLYLKDETVKLTKYAKLKLKKAVFSQVSKKFIFSIFILCIISHY